MTGVKVWDTLAIGGYLNELNPEAGLLPRERVARAHCRSISARCIPASRNLRSALPMNLKAHYPGFKVWAGAQADIDRIVAIWSECLAAYGGPYPVRRRCRPWPTPCAPVCSRFATYDVKLDPACAAYCKTIMAMPLMLEWIEAAKTRARRGRRARRRVRSAGHSGAQHDTSRNDSLDIDHSRPTIASAGSAVDPAAGAASISTKAITQGLSPLLIQLWMVPRWTMHVAGLQMHDLVIERHVDLARHHHRKVDRVRCGDCAASRRARIRSRGTPRLVLHRRADDRLGAVAVVVVVHAAAAWTRY